jgi:hypothetical protein
MKFLALLALGFGFLGCDERKPIVQHDISALVIYEKGGGFASQPKRLVIDKDGHAKLSVRTGAKLSRSSITLGADQLSELEDALDAARGVSAPTEPTGCADCFTYSVEADDLDFSLDDVSLDKAPDELGRLTVLLDRIASA